MQTLKRHDVRLQGERVLLRPMSEDDWSTLLRWNNDPGVLYFSEGDDVTGRTLEEVQRIYRGVSQNAICFIAELEGAPIGECWLQRMNLERILRQFPGRDCRRIDLVIGEKALWGKGFGTEMLRLLVGLGFEEEHADLLFGVDVMDYNVRSQKAFLKAGFALLQTVPLPPGSKGHSVCDFILPREQYRRRVA